MLANILYSIVKDLMVQTSFKSRRHFSFFLGCLSLGFLSGMPVYSVQGWKIESLCLLIFIAIPCYMKEYVKGFDVFSLKETFHLLIKNFPFKRPQLYLVLPTRLLELLSFFAVATASVKAGQDSFMSPAPRFTHIETLNTLVELARNAACLFVPALWISWSYLTIFRPIVFGAQHLSFEDKLRFFCRQEFPLEPLVAQKDKPRFEIRSSSLLPMTPP